MLSKALITLALVGTAISQTINTPASLVECQPASLTFSGGTAPYILAVIPGGQVSAAAIETLSSDLTASPFTWNTNLASGTNITFKLTDATGLIGYSSPIVIQAGSSTDCLNATAVTSGVSTGAVTTTATGSTTAVVVATSSAAATTSTTSVNSMSASSAVSAASASSSMASSSMAASSSASASSTAASSASASASATSSKAGAFPTALAGIPAIAAGVLGGLAVLL